MSERLIIRTFGAAAEVLEHVAGAGEVRALVEGEVRVRMLASPVNPADVNWMEGTYGVKPTLPETPGGEACAEVVESCSRQYAVGMRVIFLGYAYGWQVSRVVHEDELFPVPDDLDAAQCAMLKVNPATAWLLLKAAGSLPAGGAVVQNAANSGVGQCVVQIARMLGVPCVHFLRRREDEEMLRAMGATAVFPDDTAGQEQGRMFLRDNGLQAVLALNAVGGESGLRLLDLLAPEAMHVTYGAMSRRPLTVPNKFLIFQNIRVQGFWLSAWMRKATAAEVREVYASLLEWMKCGALVQRIDSRFRLGDFAEAMRRNGSAERRGKVMFEME